MNEERKWEQMTTLEQTLRSHLYHPTDLKRRMLEALPRHARRKEFREAADCQDALRRAEQEIEQWQHLIDLYLAETRVVPTTQAPPKQNETNP